MILYVETNLIMGIAKGQDVEAQDLLFNTPASISIVIPSICFLEAHTTWQNEQKHNKDFIEKINNQISESKRDITSINAQLTASSLDQSKISFQERISDVKNRFDLTLDAVANKAEEIPLEIAAIQESIDRKILEDKHLIDKIILECIIRHALLHPDITKAFLSFNSKEFGKREVAQLLQDTGIRYFSKTTNFLGWLQAQNP
ncbi:PIN domain-containing protein [Dulcicalothrix desertica]|uniref:PIN domain-containing protein n=1 Tax=Dulcicalothrix desertica TaxID=32056 RepID=UPI000F8E69A2|nr:PIN domain-containing protein [Dulcicalothrix desertica]